MPIVSQSPYELWDLTKPVVLPRSRLYHLEPVGVGTAYVESLTGYIARLAESHCLLPGVLICKEIAPSVKKVFVKKRDSRGLRALFDRATALNGIGSIACDFAQALETLTLRKIYAF
jgi:hypothetical protein